MSPSARLSQETTFTPYDDGEGFWRCAECKAEFVYDAAANGGDRAVPPKFCPNCGRRGEVK